MFLLEFSLWFGARLLWHGGIELYSVLDRTALVGPALKKKQFSPATIQELNVLVV